LVFNTIAKLRIHFAEEILLEGLVEDDAHETPQLIWL
jgi:hypothetical protein